MNSLIALPKDSPLATAHTIVISDKPKSQGELKMLIQTHIGCTDEARDEFKFGTHRIEIAGEAKFLLFALASTIKLANSSLPHNQLGMATIMMLYMDELQQEAKALCHGMLAHHFSGEDSEAFSTGPIEEGKAVASRCEFEQMGMWHIVTDGSRDTTRVFVECYDNPFKSAVEQIAAFATENSGDKNAIH